MRPPSRETRSTIPIVFWLIVWTAFVGIVGYLIGGAQCG